MERLETELRKPMQSATAKEQDPEGGHGCARGNGVILQELAVDSFDW